MSDITASHSGKIQPSAEPAAILLENHEHRIAALEKEEKSLWEKLRKRGEFGALTIGILLSSLSLFDVFVNQPSEEELAKIELFNKTINSIAGLRQSAIQIQLQSKNPELNMAINSFMLPQILANIDTATRILPDIEKKIGIPQLIILINEAMNIYDWKSAKKLVEHAANITNAPASMMSEAKRLQGRVLMLNGETTAGRAAFQKALALLAEENGFGINNARAYIVADHALVELAMGNCDEANSAAEQFVNYVQQPQIAADARSGMISTFLSQMLNLRDQNGCPIPPAALPLMPGSAR